LERKDRDSGCNDYIRAHEGYGAIGLIAEATAVSPQRTVLNLESALSLPQTLDAGVVEQITQRLHVGAYRKRPDRSAGKLLDIEHSEVCKHLLFSEKRLLSLLRRQIWRKAEAENDIDGSATSGALHQCPLEVALDYEEVTRRNPSASFTSGEGRISAAGSHPIVEAQDGGQGIRKPPVKILHDTLSRPDPYRRRNSRWAESSRVRRRSILPLTINPLLDQIAVARRTPSPAEIDHDVLAGAILEDGFAENTFNVDALIARRLEALSASAICFICVCGMRHEKHEQWKQ